MYVELFQKPVVQIVILSTNIRLLKFAVLCEVVESLLGPLFFNTAQPLPG
jgi:hypothetical protein